MKIKTPSLPVGTDNKSVEIFRTALFKCSCMRKCKIVDYAEMPMSIRERLQIELLQDKKALDFLLSIPELKKDPDLIEEAFASCRYGNYDDIPDYLDGKLTHDCPDCGIEDTCEGFNVVCKIPSFENNTLTPREFQVLKLIVRGFDDKDIANHLDIALNTAQKHMSNLRDKTNMVTRLQLGLWAAKHNIK